MKQKTILELFEIYCSKLVPDGLPDTVMDNIQFTFFMGASACFLLSVDPTTSVEDLKLVQRELDDYIVSRVHIPTLQ